MPRGVIVNGARLLSLIQPGDVLRASKEVAHSSLGTKIMRMHYLYASRKGLPYYVTIDGTSVTWMDINNAAAWLDLTPEDFLIWEVLEA
jgi:hypothetical protein